MKKVSAEKLHGQREIADAMNCLVDEIEDRLSKMEAVIKKFEDWINKNRVNERLAALEHGRRSGKKNPFPIHYP